MIEQGELITLDNHKEYICFQVMKADGETYLYLLSNFKPLEIRFARVISLGDSMELEIINDQKQKQKLLTLFQMDGKA